MPLVNDLLQPKRIFLGKKLASKNLDHQLLPKTIALPIFSSDPLSSVAYGPQELLMILTLGGIGLLSLAPGIAAVVVLLLTVIVLSYRKVIKAYPSGGGDYEVAMKNLGKKPALIVASALLLDYVMTVAVSIASGTDNLISAFPELNPYRVEIAVGFVIFLLAVNLRGVRESGVAFAIPTYLFITSVFVMIGTGLFKVATGQELTAFSSQFEVTPLEHGLGSATNAALILLVLRAFASGCSALTGIEAIANGVPAFRKPKVINAQKTMTLMGATAVFMFIGVTTLALVSRVHYAENPCEQLQQWAQCATDPQQSVMAQIAGAVFGQSNWMFYVIQAGTTAVLLLAANTAFNGFPLLSSVLANDKFAPKALLTRGDRLVFSNGMLSLSFAALILIIVYQASVTGLIQLYIIGVFTSFTIGQIGMLKHWGRLQKPKKKLSSEENAANRKEAMSGILINGLGALMTASVLVIVTITKFTHGAWLVFIIMPVLYTVMFYTRRYYDQVAAEIAMDSETTFGAKGDYAIVLMDKLNKPQLKALDYALSSRHTHLEAVHIAVDPAGARKFAQEWKKFEKELGLPLRIIESPYREFSQPLIEFLQKHRAENGDERISVYLPKLVVGHWWEHIFHNHRASRIRKQLMYLRGVMVTLVPWRLESAEYKDIFSRRPLPGDSRRGHVRPARRLHRGSSNMVARTRAKRIDED
ncbi:MAG: APC family permease [Actinomycetales bacterium]|nr:APC family permease [Actinomycetales bacterium]